MSLVFFFVGCVPPLLERLLSWFWNLVGGCFEGEMKQCTKSAKTTAPTT